MTVANRMATSAKEWSEIFKKYNSGTYNNQVNNPPPPPPPPRKERPNRKENKQNKKWIVVDYKLFTKGKPIAPNTLWILEQIPGFIVDRDMSPTLNMQGFWSSYNIPYFPFIYNISGYPEAYEKHGNSYSYEYCPRARIFRRDQGNVHNMESFKFIMRYNEWETDPLSLGNACNSISSRCDLNPPSQKPGPFGAIDAKVTSSQMVKMMAAEALCGPTNQDQPTFTWDMWKSTPHFGQPLYFDFPFVTMSPAQANGDEK